MTESKTPTDINELVAQKIMDGYAWPYSVSPFWSQSLIRHMAADGWQFTLVLNGAGCHAEFRRPADMGFGEAYVQDGIEMAVCLAALRAKGVEV